MTADPVALAATTDPQHLEVNPAVVPTVVAVRAGGHPTFDRVVIEFDGERPGYDVRYVPEVVQDPSGEPLPLRGRAFLQASVFPASTFSDEGPPGTLPVPSVAGLATLRQIAEAGDFEAVVTLGIGVAARTPFLVRQFSGPSRIAIDITHTPPGTGSQLLRRGDRGAAVATWQWRLHLALNRALAVDEIFGPATEDATRDFQRSRGLAADGIVGPLTRAAMEQALGI